MGLRCVVSGGRENAQRPVGTSRLLYNFPGTPRATNLESYETCHVWAKLAYSPTGVRDRGKHSDPRAWSLRIHPRALEHRLDEARFGLRVGLAVVTKAERELMFQPGVLPGGLGVGSQVVAKE